MKVSEATIRVRARHDEKARYQAAAEAAGVTLSVWVRRALRNGIDGYTVSRARRADAHIRMALNQLATLANDPTAHAIATEAKALLERPVP